MLKAFFRKLIRPLIVKTYQATIKRNPRAHEFFVQLAQRIPVLNRIYGRGFKVDDLQEFDMLLKTLSNPALRQKYINNLKEKPFVANDGSKYSKSIARMVRQIEVDTAEHPNTAACFAIFADQFVARLEEVSESASVDNDMSPFIYTMQ